jgi:hypothetical protein
LESKLNEITAMGLIPLHQAMVLLSNGASTADPQSDVPDAEISRPYLDQGRFSEDKASLPKTPLPHACASEPRDRRVLRLRGAREFLVQFEA